MASVYRNHLKKKIKQIKRKERVPKVSRNKQVSTLWDQAAAWYDAVVGNKGSDYQQTVVMPGAWRLLKINKGDSVLDLACGQGVFSRFMYNYGVRVEGLDVSQELIDYAMSRSHRKINYWVGDAAQKGTLQGRKFDAIVCLLAIQNMPDIGLVFMNVSKWLKPKGKFVFVTTHPCFRIPRQTHWGWDPGKKIQYRRIDHYATTISIPLITPPIATSKSFTLTYHRSLQDYFKKLSCAGLLVDALEEWPSHRTSETGGRSRSENRARKEIPLFLAVRSRLG